MMPTNDPVICSIQVGMPTPYGTEGAAKEMDRAWVTSFARQPVIGPRWLGRENLAGNQQADTKNHGGPDKAALCYGASHYPDWRAELDRPDFPHGGFGENFTIVGLTEQTACIGDTCVIGEARVQVSQPRGPCWKISRRWRIEDLTARVLATGRTGWYLRVLTEGNVEAGMPVVLLDRPYPAWTIARVNTVLYDRNHPDTAALAACPFLAAGLRDRLAKRASAA
ncbi:MAG: MOSC domain-containing protein [Chloroflexota bacterium]|nr:MOSC domain-containing protein [Chloroflexota bacterium]